MGIADRAYMRERYRRRQGLDATTWNDRKARVELNRIGRYRPGGEQTNITGRLLLTGLCAVALITGGFLGRQWFGHILSGHLGLMTHRPNGFPETGSVVVSSAVDPASVKSILTLQGGPQNAIVQLLDPVTAAHRLSIYVKALERKTVPAPVGAYRIRFIHGREWEGPRTFFGKSTVQDEVEGVMLFARGHGHTLDLALGPDSNLTVRRLTAPPESLE
jgi:hypothetical protein